MKGCAASSLRSFLLLPCAQASHAARIIPIRRQAVASCCWDVEPLAGSRVVWVSKRRTKSDWARFMRELIEVHSPDAEKIVLVMDNLNTHNPSSFYETFPPELAQRLTEKLEIHYTPTHGSWLNMAEIELSALARSLRRRIATAEELTKEVVSWQKRRNAMTTTIDWQFTTADARIKLKHLYPVVQTSEGSSSRTVTNLS